MRNGQIVQGLQFASFQASLDQFDAVFNRWMLNPDFPRPGTGVDALLARGLITIEKWGFYFVPPDTDGPIGIGMFAAAKETRKPKTGRVAVRKELVDANGSRDNGDLGVLWWLLGRATQRTVETIATPARKSGDAARQLADQIRQAAEQPAGSRGSAARCGSPSTRPPDPWSTSSLRPTSRSRRSSGPGCCSGGSSS